MTTADPISAALAAGMLAAALCLVAVAAADAYDCYRASQRRRNRKRQG